MANCQPCERSFATQHALAQHLLSSSRHSYCARCARDFVHDGALEAHLQHSASHNVCQRCADKPDFSTLAKLDDHDEAMHGLCRYCGGFLCSVSHMEEHQEEEHFVCRHCAERFQSRANLVAVSVLFRLPASHLLQMDQSISDMVHQLHISLTHCQHLRTHLPQDIECYGCTRTFRTTSAMILHLEQDNSCPSDCNTSRIDQLASEVDAAGQYYDAYGPNDLLYTCPWCQERFRFMSALLQHAESERCDAEYSSGSPLWEFLEHLSAQL